MEEKRGKIIDVCFRDNSDNAREFKHIQYFEYQIERYKDSDYCFYILEKGARVLRNTPQRRYDKGMYIIMKRSSCDVDIYQVVDFLPSEYFVVKIEPYTIPEERKPIGFHNNLK